MKPATEGCRDDRRLEGVGAAIQVERFVTHRTRGITQGPITRLMSPHDLGHIVKPFIFLDLFKKDGPELMLGLHPHSGIATVTYVIEGAVAYVDPDGTKGHVRPGGLEWMMAGKGMWHAGGVVAGRVSGFQLWLAMPPTLELAPHSSRYVEADDIEWQGPARVLLGRLGSAKGKVGSELPATYLGVKLSAGETWRFEPPKGQGVLWIAVAEGCLSAPDRIDAGEMVIFDRSECAVSITAKTDVHFVLGSSEPHNHDLAMGYYSVHTNPHALEIGERHIEELGIELGRQGRR